MDQQKIVEKVVSHLEKSIADTIVENIKTEIAQLVKNEFDRIDKRLDSIDRITSTITDDLADDRKDIGHIKVTLEAIHQGLKELIDINNRQTKTIVSKVSVEIEKIEGRVTDTVADTVPEQAKNGVKEYIEMSKPKVIQVIEKARPRRFLFWKRG